MSNQNEGTGKHGHKDTQEPYPHREAKSGDNRDMSKSDSGSKSDESLESREYKGADGDVHHHTKNYMEQHEEKEK